MNIKTILYTKTLTRQRVAVMSGFLILIVVHGCSADYGRLNRSKEITQSFESYHIFPHHRYYYQGSENRPYAIVALDQDYEIRSKFWNEFDPDPEKLKRRVDAAYRDRDTLYPFGAYLLDTDDRRIGMWYSSVRTVGITVDETQRLVSISTDQPWVRDDRKLFHGFGIKRDLH